MKSKYRVGAAAALLAAGLPTVVFAQSSASLNVSATVTSVCSIASAGGGTIAFGSVAAGATANAAGSVSITCNKGAGVSVSASSLNASGSQKRMRIGATSDYLDYTVWQPDLTTPNVCATAQTDWTGALAMGSVWSGSGGPRTVAVCATTSPTNLNNSGTYNDTLTISISVS